MRVFKVILAIIGVIVAIPIIGLAWLLWSLDIPDDSPRDAAPMARVLCGDAIKRILRNPSSAEMLDQPTWPVQHDPPLYIVLAVVRAENGFGGMAIETFTCEMSSTDGRSFSAVNVVQ